MKKRIVGWSIRKDRWIPYQGDKKRSTVQESVIHLPNSQVMALTNQRRLVLVSPKLTNTQSKFITNNLTTKIMAILPKSTQQLFPTLTCSQEVSLASHFQLLEKEGDLTTPEELYFLTSRGYSKKNNQNIFYSKTLKGCFLTTMDELLKPLSPRLQNWGIAWNGKCLTQKISASPKIENVCSLSDILEKSPDKKYFLSEQQQKRLLSLKPSERGGGKSLTKKHAWDLIQLNKPTHSNDRVYSPEGISPTLNTMQGGRRQPFIAAQRGRYNTDGSTSQKLEPRKDGVSNTLTRVEKDNLVVQIPEATKKGYAEAKVGDSINLSVPNSTTRRGRVGNKIAQTLDTGMQQHTLTENAQIRRLTPLECERLMGLPDNWCKYGTEGKISNSQRYKLCGNGVVVNVVEEIIKKLYERK